MYNTTETKFVARITHNVLLRRKAAGKEAETADRCLMTSCCMLSLLLILDQFCCVTCPISGTEPTLATAVIV